MITATYPRWITRFALLCWLGLLPPVLLSLALPRVPFTASNAASLLQLPYIVYSAPGEGVGGLAFTPGGQLTLYHVGISTASGDQRQAVDAFSGQRVVFNGTGVCGVASPFALSAEGARLACQDGLGRRVYVWDAASGRGGPVYSWDVGRSVGALTFDRAGARLAFLDRSGSHRGVHVWQPEDESALAWYPNPPQSDRFEEVWTPLALSPDGRYLAFRFLRREDQYEALRLWDLDRDAIQADILPGAYGPLAFSPDNTLLAVQQHETLTLWRVADGALLVEAPLPPVPYPLGISFSPDGSLLAAAAGDGRVYLWGVRG